MIAPPGRIGFGRRAAASLIDGLLIVVLSVVVAPLLGGLLGASLLGGATGTGGGRDEAAAFGGFFGAVGGLLVGGVVVGIVYYLSEGLIGLTVGKLLLGIQIGAVSGTPADREALFTRSTIKNGGLVLAILGAATGVHVIGTLGRLAILIVGLGFLLTLGAARQALHDRAAKTAVFQRRDLTGGRRVSHP
jgi:uncharacterized RDD family membrane protein YckC